MDGQFFNIKIKSESVSWIDLRPPSFYLWAKDREDLKCKFLLNLAVSILLSLSLPLSSPMDIPPLITNLLFRFVLYCKAVAGLANLKC